MQLGAFNPFFRNHNGLHGTNQDPASFGPQIAESMRKTVLIRYTLIPYLYTLFYNAHLNGGTVVRSLIHEFSSDKKTFDIDEQFLWGSSLLISPVINPGRTFVDAYLPSQARWFDYYSGREVNSGSTRLNAPRDFIPLHVRGGSILPVQEPGKNTDESRKQPFGLIIAPDENGNAFGSLYSDDGESYDSVKAEMFSLFEFNYSSNSTEALVELNLKNDGYLVSNSLNRIRLFGVKTSPKEMLVLGKNFQLEFTFDNISETVEIKNANLAMNSSHKVLIKF